MIPWKRKWQPTPVFLPEKSHGQRNLAGYSPKGHKRIGHSWATERPAPSDIIEGRGGIFPYFFICQVLIKGSLMKFLKLDLLKNCLTKEELDQKTQVPGVWSGNSLPRTLSLPQAEAVFGPIEKPEKLPYSATSSTIITWIVKIFLNFNWRILYILRKGHVSSSQWNSQTARQYKKGSTPISLHPS